MEPALSILSALVTALIICFIGQTALVWNKLGKIEGAVKKSCPFGQCPVYERAKHEAALPRVVKEAEDVASSS